MNSRKKFGPNFFFTKLIWDLIILDTQFLKQSNHNHNYILMILVIIGLRDTLPNHISSCRSELKIDNRNKGITSKLTKFFGQDGGLSLDGGGPIPQYWPILILIIWVLGHNIYFRNKLGLSWAKLNSSWDLTSL